MLLFWKNIYTYNLERANLWQTKEHGCSADVCAIAPNILLPSKWEPRIWSYLCLLVPSFQYSLPLIFFPKKTTVHIIKSKYFFFCSLLDQLMIIRKELPLVLKKKEYYVNKNFSSAMPSRLIKLSGPICGAIRTFQPSQNSLHKSPLSQNNILICWRAGLLFHQGGMLGFSRDCMQQSSFPGVTDPQECPGNRQLVASFEWCGSFWEPIHYSLPLYNIEPLRVGFLVYSSQFLFFGLCQEQLSQVFICIYKYNKMEGRQVTRDLRGRANLWQNHEVVAWGKRRRKGFPVPFQNCLLPLPPNLKMQAHTSILYSCSLSLRSLLNPLYILC